jgi:hypothetical protein
MGRWMGRPASDPDSPTGLAAAALVRRLPDGSWGWQIERLEAGRSSGGATVSVMETTDLGLGHDPPLARSRAAGERCLRGTGGAVTRGNTHVERAADELRRSRGRGRGALPAEDGLRLDDEQTRPPASPQAGKPTPEDPISPMEPRALEDGYLPAERQVLRASAAAAPAVRPLRRLPRADRVASLGPEVGKRNEWRKVPRI